MNNKEGNARMLDPQRFQVAKNMSVLPGGPQNNNPMNVTDNASPAIQAASIYGDYSQNYMQMGVVATAGKLALGAQEQAGANLRTAMTANPYANSTMQAPSISY